MRKRQFLQFLFANAGYTKPEISRTQGVWSVLYEWGQVLSAAENQIARQRLHVLQQQIRRKLYRNRLAIE